MNREKEIKSGAVVIGASAGGIQALIKILSLLPDTYSLPIIIVLHISDAHQSTLPAVFKGIVKLPVKEAQEKEEILGGTIYFAPPGYHLLIESDHTFSLSNEEPVFFSRPSINVTFESAAYVYGKNLTGILLTGASQDGAMGLKKIKELGGSTIIQDPKSAEHSEMPSSGIPYVKPENIMTLDLISKYLVSL
jgi:two-component system chemotaxis response regulator CheB